MSEEKNLRDIAIEKEMIKIQFEEIRNVIEKESASISKIFKFCALENERIINIEKQNENHKKVIKYLTQQIGELQVDMMKMKYLYYHVFPDRLQEDAHISDQIDALTFKPEPDEDPKKA